MHAILLLIYWYKAKKIYFCLFFPIQNIWYRKKKKFYIRSVRTSNQVLTSFEYKIIHIELAAYVKSVISFVTSHSDNAEKSPFRRKTKIWKTRITGTNAVLLPLPKSCFCIKTRLYSTCAGIWRQEALSGC